MTHLVAPNTDFSQSLDLLMKAQVTTDYRAIVRNLAGPLIEHVQIVFPGHFQLVYLVTDVSRRQIWNASLAARGLAALHALSRDEISALRGKLLTSGSLALLAETYGNICQGVLGLYGKLGGEARDPDFYANFYELVSHNEKLRSELAHRREVVPYVIQRLFGMPTELQSYAFARELACDRDVTKFLLLYEHIKAQEFRDKPVMIDRLLRGVMNGKGFRAPLRKILCALPFPPQAVPDEGCLKFLATGSHMRMAARRYRNCLASHISFALTGERQFYEWNGEMPLVICLRRYRGSFWYIFEMKAKHNVDPPHHVEQHVRAHFERYGIGHKGCIVDIFDRFLEEENALNGEEVEMLFAELDAA